MGKPVCIVDRVPTVCNLFGAWSRHDRACERESRPLRTFAPCQFVECNAWPTCVERRKALPWENAVTAEEAVKVLGAWRPDGRAPAGCAAVGMGADEAVGAHIVCASSFFSTHFSKSNTNLKPNTNNAGPTHASLALPQTCTSPGQRQRLPCTPPVCAGSFWGTTFRPGDVLDLPVDQMEALLKATSTGEGSKVSEAGWRGCSWAARRGVGWGTQATGRPLAFMVLHSSLPVRHSTLSLTHSTALPTPAQVLDNALFAHAESVSSRFFGKDVYYRGIVEFSNVSGQGWADAGARCFAW